MDAYYLEQMGHHSISITVDIYGHWIRSGNREAVNRLGEQIAASHTQVTLAEAPSKIKPS
jgi:hypothetical protein